MRILFATLCFLLTFPYTISASIPSPLKSIDQRDPEPVLISPSDAILFDHRNAEIYAYLEKRRGGGGGGRGGGSSGGSKGGGSSGGSSGSGSKGGGSSGSGAKGSGTSSTSSFRPTYGGSRYYAGGSSTAYTAGARSPLGLTPLYLSGASLALFPGLWLYSVYAYPYSHPYLYHNETSGRNESLPVDCLCEEYQACGCDENGNMTALGEAVKNGTAQAVVLGNGTSALVVNGTLPNGTVDGESGGQRGMSRLGWEGVCGVVFVVVVMVWGL